MASDSKQWKRWRVVWTIAFIAGWVIIGRDSETARSTLIGLGQVHRVLCVSILGFFVIPLFIRSSSIPFRSIFFLWTIFAIWQSTTSLWSTFPAWTFYRSIEYLIMVLITAYCASNLKNYDQWVKWVNLIWFFVGLLIFSVWVSVVISPGSALMRSPSTLIPYMISGTFPRINPNSVSTYGAIIGIISFVRHRYSQGKKWKFLFLFAIVTMFLSQGRSGMGAFGLGIIMALVLMRRYHILFASAAILGFLLTYYALDSLFWEYFRRGQSVEQFWMFSGRMNIWEYTYNNYIVDQPVIGYGAYSAGRFLVLSDYMGWSSLHSTWLEIAVGNGIPATIVFACVIVYAWMIIVKCCLNNSKNMYNRYFIEIAAVYTALIFRSFFTIGFMTHNDIIFFLVMGSAYFIKRIRKFDENNS